MAREGLFDDLDAAITWHPDQLVGAANTKGSQAVLDLSVRRLAGGARRLRSLNRRSAADAAEALHARRRPHARARATDRADALRDREAGDAPTSPEHARSFGPGSATWR
ncbi:MAG: hypothetical protein R2991_03175 [Thermoanaerobaculia bacterium]